MFDSKMREQLKNVFSPMSASVELIYKNSLHDDQKVLLEMLSELSQTNELIVVKASSETSDVPEFSLKYKGEFNGITFKGIPNGHEFTSLVLAILNSDGKGKFPDEQILARIKNLKGPIHLQTFISLSCENCPDVVQALNLMAIVHPDFKHEMVDGAYFQTEAKNLGIQGVPAIIHNNQLISSGKMSFIELLDKLENILGKKEINLWANEDLGSFDVVVIGGGPAGVSAAIYTSRKGLKTAMIAERIGGQVKDTKGIENLISVQYTEGPLLAASLMEHLKAYPVRIFEHRRVKSLINDTVKTIILESGEIIKARAIIVATGAKWRELGIPGEKEYKGLGVAFCPHCDGPFYKNKKVAVVGGGNSGVEAAIDLAGIVHEVTLFEYMDTLKADKILVDKLKSLSNVKIITHAKTEKIIGDGKKVTALQYLDRMTNENRLLELDGLFIQIGLIPNSQFINDFVEVNRNGEIVVDSKGRTNSKGIYAAGDVTTVPYKQIIISMGEGAKAGLSVFEDLMLS